MAEEDSKTATPPAPARPRAVRLTIAYDGDRLELVAQQSVTMTVPPSDPVQAPRAAQAGFWVDLKDAEDRTLYRRLLHEPVRRDVEVFSPDAARTVERAPVTEPRGVFSVVLPELEAAEAVSLISPPGAPDGGPRGLAAEPPREIARFPLKRER